MNPSTEQYLKNLQMIPTIVRQIISDNSKNFLVYEKFHNIVRNQSLFEAIKYTQNNPFFIEGTFEKCIDKFEEVMGMKD